MATAPAATTNTPGDDFDAMFANLVREEGAPNPATVAPPNPATPPAEAPAATTQEPAPVAQEGDAPQETEIEPLGEGETGAEPPPPPEPTDALSRLADMLAARQPQPQVQQPQPQVQQPQPTGPVFDQNERAFLTQYETDFPDVSRAEAMKRRVEYNALVTHIFSQVSQYLAPRLALLDQIAETTQYRDLTEVVPDYDEVRDKVVAWTKTQPAYLQAAFNHVIEQGTVDEINDLIDRYRQATGTASPNPGGGIAPPAQGGGQVTQQPARAPELSTAAKQAASRLAPVGARRSAPTQAQPLDFDAAFDQFAKVG